MIFSADARMADSNYLQLGRWCQCAHCGVILEAGAQHYCGAPWQQRAADIPTDWVPLQYKSPKKKDA